MAAGQLSLWGAGMFEGPLALDVIFDNDEIARRTIQQVFFNIFAGVLVAEGEISPHTPAGEIEGLK